MANCLKFINLESVKVTLMRVCSAVFGLILSASMFGQSPSILEVNPLFPHQGDTVLVTYISSLGNAALIGTSTIYAHTGVLTTSSSGPSNWQYVQGVWGSADPNVLMTAKGNGIFEKQFHIPTFYGFPTTTSVTDLAFVFRNVSGNLVGRNADGSDIFYPIYSNNSPLEVSWNCGSRLKEALPGDTLWLLGEASKSAQLEIYANGSLLALDTAARSLGYGFIAPNALGRTEIILKATSGSNVVRDTLIVVTNNAVNQNADIICTPAFPTLADTLDLYYTSEAGNSTLLGIHPIYMHTGLITQSGGAGNWQNVQGIWGTADSNVQMTRLAKDVWHKEMYVAGFYGISPSTPGVLNMTMVFRDSSGAAVGKTASNTDIEYALYPVPASNFSAQFITPNNQALMIGGSFLVQASSSASATLTIRENGTVLNTDTGVYTLQHLISLANSPIGWRTLVLETTRNGQQVYDTLNFQVLGAQPVGGKILEVVPPFPTQNDTIQVIYDSFQGNGALKYTSPVFAHTGVITTASTSPSNWQHVQGNWGTADSSVWMQDLGGGKHSLYMDLPTFYGYSSSTIVEELAFVFRDSLGSLVGRSYGGEDIYYPITQNPGNFEGRFFTPSITHVLQSGQCLSLEARTNLPGHLSIYDNGQLIASDSATTELIYCQPHTGSAGNHLVELVAVGPSGATDRDTVFYVSLGNFAPIDPPVGLKNGANYLNDSTIVLVLYAPSKSHVFVLTENNSFIPHTAYQMHRGFDASTYWLQLDVPKGQDFVYQYLVDGKLQIADPFSERILDPQNDGQISVSSYPNPYPYPSSKASGHMSIVTPGAPAYNWMNTSFQAPNKSDLVIYELLVRDFVAPRNYRTITDSVNYLSKLNINAVEFMPVNEFESNLSWGYNPSYHMALDKYYGTPEAFKELVDSLHGCGIAVILDVVLNHAEGQNPLVQLWFDEATNKPSGSNPYFNSQCPHPPNCWGYDLNHESQATKDYVDQILKYWIEEYHVDGFRLDFTKGFTNGAGSGWDVNRQNILKRIANEVWTYKPNCYLILEHWGDNNEEIALSNHGFLLWGNEVHQYQEATMGFSASSNFSTAYHGNRGWNQPGLVTYMESHDEERIAYKNLAFGNNAVTNHNVRSTPVSMERMELSFLFSHLTPGPKMMYQFQELGYDVSIDNPCRVCVKPLKWNYYQQIPRRRLYETVGIVNGLKQDYPTFGVGSNFYADLYGHVKQMGFIHPNMDAVVIGNFDVASQSKTINFSHTGTWYEYFTGQTLNVTNNQTSLTLSAGEYRLYTDDNIPGGMSQFSIEEVGGYGSLSVFPNPATRLIHFDLPSNDYAECEYVIYDAFGRIVHSGSISNFNSIDISTLSNGLYVLDITDKTNLKYSSKFTKL